MYPAALLLDPDNGIQLAGIATGDEPFDIKQISASLMAVSQFKASSVIFINTSTFEMDDSLAVIPHPRGLALSADSIKLYVTHFLSGALSIVDIATLKVEKMIKPESDGNLFQNLAVTGDGTRLYLPLTRANVTNKARLFDTTVFPVVSVIDPVSEVAVPGERFSLDIVDEPVGIPIDATLTDDYLFILNAGSNDLTVLNRSNRQTDAHLELGHNPRSMMLSSDGSRLFIHNSLSGSVSVVDIDLLSITDVLTVETKASTIVLTHLQASASLQSP